MMIAVLVFRSSVFSSYSTLFYSKIIPREQKASKRATIRHMQWQWNKWSLLNKNIQIHHDVSHKSTTRTVEGGLLRAGAQRRSLLGRAMSNTTQRVVQYENDWTSLGVVNCARIIAHSPPFVPFIFTHITFGWPNIQIEPATGVAIDGRYENNVFRKWFFSFGF